MNLEARRARDQQHRRECALAEMRDAVTAAIIARHPDAQDAAIDAVGEATLQLFADGGYLAEPGEVKNRLFVRADRRMIDRKRRAETKRRVPVALDERAQSRTRARIETRYLDECRPR